MQTKTLVTLALRLQGRPDLARYMLAHINATAAQREAFARACGLIH